MEDWTRVVLYGTFDGFGWSTDGDDNILLVLDNGDKVEIPNHFVKNASDFVEKNKIKLKDVIARIKQLDIGTRKAWLNEILNEIGSDFGSAKYKDGYEQGKLEGEWVGQQLKDADKIRQELNKPVVPQVVADWDEENKDSFDSNLWEYLTDWEKQEPSDFKNWINDENNVFQTLVNMQQFGYTVEKEKRYKVVMPNISSTGGVLTRIKHDDSWIWIDTLGTIIEGQTHTRKELEQAGFGWVFDCEGVEVEEVE